MRFLRRSLTGLFLLSLTLGLLTWAGTLVRDAVEARLGREPRVPTPSERVFAVGVQMVEPTRITPVLTVFGEVQSRRTLDIRAAAAGTVVYLAPEFVEGGQVVAGQLLLRTDPANALSARDRAASDQLDAEAEEREAARALALAHDELAAAEEQAGLRQKAFERQADLQARGVGTAAAVETAELAAASARQAVVARRQAVAQAEARVDQAATRRARTAIALAEAERRLADTEISAGFSGTLSGVTLVEGGLVTANERLAQLVDPDALEAVFRVSTAQYTRLLDAEGALTRAPVTVALDVFGTALETTGTLSRDSAAVGAGQTGRLLFASLDAARGLKPGDFVTVRLSEPALDRVVLLPSSAHDAAGRVLVLGDDDRLEEVTVDLVRRQGDDVILRAGPIAGREVVKARTPLLGAGIKVRPLRGDGAPVPEEPELVELTPERRAKLVAFVEANGFIPDEAKARILGQLAKDKVPAKMVARIESRMGG